jgi:hypothetical protein
MMKLTSQQRSDLTQFFMKGPVNNAYVRGKILFIKTKVKHLFTKDEWFRLEVAQSHAYLGEGRQEWDTVCDEIKECWGWKKKGLCNK